MFNKGHAIAQAVSHRLPTAAVWIRAWFRSCGICGGQSGTRTGFLRVLRFPLPIRIPLIAPQSSSSIIWGWYNRPNSDRSTKWTHPTMNIKKKCLVSTEHSFLELMSFFGFFSHSLLKPSFTSGQWNQQHRKFANSHLSYSFMLYHLKIF
jgi:hypothetical protein